MINQSRLVCPFSPRFYFSLHRKSAAHPVRFLALAPAGNIPELRKNLRSNTLVGQGTACILAAQAILMPVRGWLSGELGGHSDCDEAIRDHSTAPLANLISVDGSSKSPQPVYNFESEAAGRSCLHFSPGVIRWNRALTPTRPL